MMKRIAVSVALVVFLSMARGGHAADLQAGWYVKRWAVSLEFYDELGRPNSVHWSFAGGMGTYGPCEGTSPDPIWAERLGTIPTTALDVAPGTGVYLGGVPDVEIPFDLTGVGMGYETNYDASQVRLELLDYSGSTGYTLLWAESRSGLQHAFQTVVWSYEPVIRRGHAVVFRVTTVPEPCGLVVVLTGLCVAGTRKMGRIKRW